MATPTITFRIPHNLQQMAKAKAKKMGIPLTVVLQKALETFIHSDTITLTENGFTPEFENFILKSESESSSRSFSNSEDAIHYLRKS